MSETPSNMVTWFQLPADDEARARAFYNRVFGWTPEDSFGAPRAGAIHGEITKRTEDLSHPRLVIRVEDLDGVLSEAVEAGGAVAQARTEIPEIGKVFAAFRDPEGNILNVVADLPG